MYVNSYSNGGHKAVQCIVWASRLRYEIKSGSEHAVIVLQVDNEQATNCDKGMF